MFNDMCDCSEQIIVLYIYIFDLNERATKFMSLIL